jgi:HEAT repeat protein
MNRRGIAAVALALMLGGGLGAQEPQASDKSVESWVRSLLDAAIDKREAGLKAVKAAGPQQRKAVAARLRPSLSTADPIVRVRCALMLWRVEGRAGESLPVLLKALGDPKMEVCSAALFALGDMGAAAREAVPAVEAFLRNRSARLRCHAAYNLWKIDPKSSQPLPALRRVLEERDEDAWADIFNLISLMRGAARELAPMLVGLTKDRDANVRSNAVITLGDIHPDPALVVPALHKALHDTNGMVRGNAAIALGNIGAKGPPTLALVRALLKDDDPLVRVQAAITVWRLDRDAKTAVPVLTEALDHDKGTLACVAAVQALGQVGPEAKGAIPALLALRKKAEGGWGRQAIEETVRKIDPKVLPAAPPKERP